MFSPETLGSREDILVKLKRPSKIYTRTLVGLVPRPCSRLHGLGTRLGLSVLWSALIQVYTMQYGHDHSVNWMWQCNYRTVVTIERSHYALRFHWQRARDFTRTETQTENRD